MKIDTATKQVIRAIENEIEKYQSGKTSFMTAYRKIDRVIMMASLKKDQLIEEGKKNGDHVKYIY